MTDVIENRSGFDAEVTKFGNQRLSVLEGFTVELQQAVSNPDAADFQQIVSHAVRILSMSDLDMSLMFKVSRPTANRWIRGVTAPHPLGRKSVYDALIEEVRKALRATRIAS